jgi:dihydrodipicolinate synthase/N-acetylneuraminate lyase
LLPEACCRLYRLTTEGKRVEALALQQQLVSLSRLVGSTYGVPGLKAALRIAGIDAGVPRPPLMPLADAGVAALREALSQLEDSLHESPA